MHTTFQTVGLIGKRDDTNVAETVTALIRYLDSSGIRVLLDESVSPLADGSQMADGSPIECVTTETIGEQCDLAIVVGGDGTLLSAARTLADYQIPLAGVNLGRLGFLVDISPDHLSNKMDEILRGHYLEERRFLLQGDVYREGERIAGGLAFNDVVVHKWNLARMIELETYINDRFVNTQRSDGLIISTPTGSSAYALSGGGPLLYPTLNAIVLVPVCPHTLSNRPIVVDGDSHIEVVVADSNEERTQVTWDGQDSFSLRSGDRIKIYKRERELRLIHPANHDYFETLRAKLHWG
ncbi:MAG: NAD(+) kinase [Gammaproteobacteria bacterium]|nr:NAD(+) kinase [Gammaproteobacteria bacterium]